MLLAACSEDPPAPQPRAAASPSPTLEATCPLTGESPPPGIDLARPAVAVKIENSPQARPQHGLEDADLVFEEIVEGGITRFMAIYHCGKSSDAGPVRSARFDDPKIARPFTRVIAYSGSNGFVDRELENRRMITLNEINQRGAFFRVPPGEILVHNLFVRTEVLRNDRRVRRADPPASDLFEFGPVPGDARRARFVGLHFNKSVEISYRWRRGSWYRFEDGPFMTNDGEQIAVPNVLVQQVEVNNSGRLVDSAGNPSPKIDLKHGGKAWLFRDGRVLTGTWKAKNGRFIYKTKQREPFVFATGPIWVELVPSRKGEVKGSLRFR
ncbi:MAG: DUF3048 domain-containing protein [Actinomycetota bacterium]|nr:DUF3048 domain-containing protein [Actinomycetota bacterium]